MKAKLIYEGLKDKLVAPTNNSIKLNIQNNYKNQYEHIIDSIDKLTRNNNYFYNNDGVTCIVYNKKDNYIRIYYNDLFDSYYDWGNITHNEFKNLLKYCIGEKLNIIDDETIIEIYNTN